MFHQVNIRKEDQYAQRFLWRDGDSKREPEHYAMRVMTLLIYITFSEQYPRAVNCIIDQHYVDDLLDSADTEEDAIRLAMEVRSIHQKAGFEIRNWLSNSLNVLAELESTSLQSKNLDIKPELITEKVLGMWWSTKEDVFTYSVTLKKINEDIWTGKRCPTKREKYYEL